MPLCAPTTKPVLTKPRARAIGMFACARSTSELGQRETREILKLVHCCALHVLMVITPLANPVATKHCRKTMPIDAARSPYLRQGGVCFWRTSP